MMKAMITGAAAGAIGTVALDLAGYVDMTVHGRPASSVPATLVQKIAERLDAYADVGEFAKSDASDAVKARRDGIGALLGHGNGIGIGMLYGGVRSVVAIPWPLAGVCLGIAAMAASDVPAAQLGATDPASWDQSAWISDIVPHLIYGLVAAASYDFIAAA